MPEGLEAEIWRRAARVVIGRRIERVDADERAVDPDLRAVVGERFTDVRRHGKVLLLDTTGPTLGVRFGMTGRLVVDGASPIESLAYSSARDRCEWDRLRVFTGSEVPALRLNDPRRLGRVEVDPDLSSLGPDVLDVDRARFGSALAGRRASVKATLLNQAIVAGLGNLCVDEVLFHAGIDPARLVASLRAHELDAIHESIRRRLPTMLAAGGSTEGLLDPRRRADLGPCPQPACGGVLRRRTIGGRTTVWCPEHQAADP